MKLSDKLVMMLEMECLPRPDIPTIEEAIALAKRYEDAPVGRLVCTSRGFMAEPEDMNDHRFWSSGRVRIVLDKEAL